MEAVVDTSQYAWIVSRCWRSGGHGIEAEEAALMVEFADLRRRQAEATQADAKVRAAQAGFAADELRDGAAPADRTVPMTIRFFFFFFLTRSVSYCCVSDWPLYAFWRRVSIAGAKLGRVFSQSFSNE